jgi:hypothetical protein
MADTNLRIKIGMVGSADVNAGLRAIGSAAAGLQATLAGIAASVGAVVSLGAAIQQSVKFNAELEQQAVAFKTLLGNAEAASRRMRELTRFAAETPFELPEVVQASKVLQSLTDGALATGEGLRMVGDAASATGRPIEDVTMWVGRLYAGLQTGTPVGEATLRLIEMGMISGTTARKLNDLAETAQGSGRAFTILKETFSKFDGAMAEGSKTFNGLLSNLKDVVNLNLGDIGKPLFDSLKTALEAAIPAVEEFGKDASASLAVIFEAYENGQITELIGLTIEAGFEVGTNAAIKILEGIFTFLGSADMWAVVGNGLLTAINESMKLAGLAMVDFILVPLGAIASYVYDAFSYAFESVVDFFAADLEKVINASAQLLNKVFGTNLPEVKLTGGGKAFQAPDFMRSFAENQAGGQVAKDSISGFFNESTAAGRSLMGIGTGLSVGTGAQDSLLALQAKKRAQMEAAKVGDWQGPLQQKEEVALINVKLELQKLELSYSNRLQQLNQDRGAVESSWLMTNNQKYQEKKRLMGSELDLINRQIFALKELKATATETEQIQIDQRIVGLQGAAGGVNGQMTGMGPDPQSMGENFQATLINLQNQFGTVAQQMAATFADVFNAATASISTGIQGLIMGTMTWGQALQNIGLSIVNSIVKSFADMVAGWIMSHVIMKGVSVAWSGFQTMLRGKDVVEANATELAKTPALAANATLASIGSYGVAAVIGIAAIAGILAMVGGFKQGGYTGDGNPNDVAGIVHRGEYVVPADAVDRIGLSSLNAMASGGVSDAGAFTSAAAPGPITLNMGVFDNPARLNDWARSNEGRTVLVDIMRQHSHEFSRA